MPETLSTRKAMPSSPLAASPNEAKYVNNNHTRTFSVLLLYFLYILMHSSYSYFNLPSSALVTPPLLLNFSNPSASDNRDFEALGWSRSMPQDGVPTESSHSNSFFTSRRASRSRFSQRPTGTLFGVDPPRPPREGYE